ncbi:MAG: prepilin-type N-terminal cleavage/methylation domain-containing protein [Polyangiaceae bacterium]
MVQAPRIRCRRQAGFTLVELMAVVVITGILAIVGVAVFRKYIFSAKSGEAMSVIQAIRGAEESYLAENHVYLNVSTSGGTDAVNGKNWYPRLVPNRDYVTWGVGGDDLTNWKALGPGINHPVQFSYLVNAGLAGVAMTKPQDMADPGFGIPPQSWYLIQAKGDTDGDGVFVNYASSSMTGVIYSERDGE